MNNANDVLGQMSKLVTANSKTTGILGARAMVLGKFLEVVVPHLTTLQCVEVTKSFRHGIGDAMSLMDDVTLPAEYHSSLLELTNSILAALSKESPKRR
jgi:hypothetical protein